MLSSSYHGLLVLDKPGGITSRAAVDRALRWFPRGTRVGHTGTLDPLATGVLVLCLGIATRLTEYVQDMSKVYRAGVRLGARSDSDDADGTITPAAVEQPPTREQVEETLRAFVGEIEQVPPVYSAARVTGRRAYSLARQGREVTLSPRRVQVYEIQVLIYAYPRLDLRIHCGKGTYIRSLARDLGGRLGCGGLVESLRRERVGPFAAEHALSLDVDCETAVAHLLPLSAAVAELPRLVLDADAVTRLCHGQRLAFDALPAAGTEFAIFDNAGALAAVAQLDRGEGVLRPVKVLITPALEPPMK